MPVPQYNRLGFLQGAQVGLDSSKAALDAKIRREAQAQQQAQFAQSAEEEKRRNLATESLSGQDLAEKSREFNTGFGDTQARTGLLTRQQAENERQGSFGRDLSNREFGLKDFDVRNQALAQRMQLGETRRSNIAREGLSGRELTETQRRNLAEEMLSGGKLSLEERAQQETERATREQEAYKGRQLTVEEQDMLRKEALSRASLAEQQRSALAQEALGVTAETRQESALSEAKRAAQVMEAFRERQLQQSGSEFGQTFGLQQRQQAETERRNPILEAIDRARADAEIERSGVQNQVSLGGLDISRRAQTEAETEGKFGRGAKTRQLNQADAALQFQYFNAQLDNAVKNREIDAGQANSIRSYASEMSRQGLDLQKWVGEQAQRDATTAQSYAAAGGVTPWRDALEEKRRESDATLAQQGLTSYPNTPQGMAYKAALNNWEANNKQEPNFALTPQGMAYAARLKEWNDNLTDSRDLTRDQEKNKAFSKRQNDAFTAKHAMATEKAAREGDPWMKQWVQGAGLFISKNSNPYDGPNMAAQQISAQLDQWLMNGVKPAGYPGGAGGAGAAGDYSMATLHRKSADELNTMYGAATTQAQREAILNAASDLGYF